MHTRPAGFSCRRIKRHVGARRGRGANDGNGPSPCDDRGSCQSLAAVARPTCGCRLPAPFRQPAGAYSHGRRRPPPRCSGCSFHDRLVRFGQLLATAEFNGEADRSRRSLCVAGGLSGFAFLAATTLSQGRHAAAEFQRRGGPTDAAFSGSRPSDSRRAQRGRSAFRACRRRVVYRKIWRARFCAFGRSNRASQESAWFAAGVKGDRYAGRGCGPARAGARGLPRGLFSRSRPQCPLHWPYQPPRPLAGVRIRGLPVSCTEQLVRNAGPGRAGSRHVGRAAGAAARRIGT